APERPGPALHLPADAVAGPAGPAAAASPATAPHRALRRAGRHRPRPRAGPARPLRGGPVPPPRWRPHPHPRRLPPRPAAVHRTRRPDRRLRGGTAAIDQRAAPAPP